MCVISNPMELGWDIQHTCTMYNVHLHTCTCTSSSCHLVGHNVVVPPPLLRLFCWCTHWLNTHYTVPCLVFQLPLHTRGPCTPCNQYTFVCECLSSVLCLQGTCNILMITSMYMYICTYIFIGVSIFYLRCV